MRRRNRWVASVVLIWCLLAGRGAVAAEDHAVRVRYDDALIFEGPHEKIQLNVWAQTDARGFFSGHPNHTQFLIRRARLDLRGTYGEHFAFRFMPNFETGGGANTGSLTDLWVEYRPHAMFQVRVGQFKEPFGLENLLNDLWADFLERSIADNFVRPDRDLGVMFSGHVAKKFTYGVGVFNGSGFNTAENNEGKDIAARLTVSPWAGGEHALLADWTLGSSFTYGRLDTSIDASGPSTQVGTRVLAFVNPTAGTDVNVNGNRYREGADLEWRHGPFDAKAEYVAQQLHNMSGLGLTHNWRLQGGALQFSWVVTGEPASNEHALAPTRHWGAVQVGVRGEWMRSNRDVVTSGLAGGATELWGVTTALHWTLNPHALIGVDYHYTHFDAPVVAAGAKNFEHALIARAQFSF